MQKILRSVPDYILPILRNPDFTRVGFSLGLAGLALGQALQNGNGGFTVPAMYWLTGSFICLGYALIAPQKPLEGLFSKISFPILLGGLLWQIIQLATKYPGVSHQASSLSTIWLFKLGAIVAGILAFLSLVPKDRISSMRQNLLVCLTLLVIWLMGVWIIKSSPEPRIDVFVFQQMSGEALLEGRNPYTLTPPNIYGHMLFYGEELVKDGFLTIGNPYPPLSIFFATLGYLTGGDIRYSYLLAIVLSGAFIAFLQSGRETKLAAYILLFTPRVFYLLEQSWTEPIVVLFLTATVYCAIHHPRWLPLMLGLLFASKQYLLFLIPLTLLLIPPKSSWRNWIGVYGGMAVVAVAVTAPLALWDFPAFMWNVGEAQWHQIFRMDALSYLALYARVFNQTPSQLIGFVALAVAYLLVWRFISRTPSGFVAGFALCLGLFFAFNKQAFCNYYFLVIGAICCTLASLPIHHPIPQEENLLSEQPVKAFS
jgi:hypothetical protein